MNVNWLLVIVLIIMLFFALRGWRRGFLRLLYDIAAVFIAVFLVSCMTPYIENLFVYLAAICLMIILLVLVGRLLLKVNKIPVIGKINRAAGVAAGVFFSLFIIWLIFMAIEVISVTGLGTAGMEYIDESLFLTYLYENNAVLEFLLK